MSKRVRFDEGQWFAVPLPSGGYAFGLLARWSVKTKIGLGYFFGPRTSTTPASEQTLDKDPDDAVLTEMFNCLGLIDHSWPLIQSTRAWNRDHWPVPRFGHFDEYERKAWIREYDDIGRIHAREFRSTPEEIATLPRDGLAGAGAIEALLDRLLPQ
jgi:hypothetical protein